MYFQTENVNLGMNYPIFMKKDLKYLAPIRDLFANLSRKIDE